MTRTQHFEPDIAYRSDSYDVLLALVAADFGVALIPEMAAVPRAGVTFLQVSQPAEVARDIHITTRTADTSPATKALAGLVLRRRTHVGSKTGMVES